jgi:hypothetical protein
MRKDQIRGSQDAMVYIVDCTLATVETMALCKSRSKSEYQRQAAIAQIGVDWLLLDKVPIEGTRIASVKEFGSVQKWADSFAVPAGVRRKVNVVT